MPIGENLNLKRDKVIPDKKNEDVTSKSNEITNNPQPEDKSIGKKIILNEESYHITVNPSKRKKVRKTNIKLSGDLSVKNIESIDKQVRSILNSYDLIDVYLENVDKYDLCTIQMLYTYSRFHNTNDKTKLLKIIVDLQVDLQKLTKTCGFSEFIYQHKG